MRVKLGIRDSAKHRNMCPPVLAYQYDLNNNRTVLDVRREGASIFSVNASNSFITLPTCLARSTQPSGCTTLQYQIPPRSWCVRHACCNRAHFLSNSFFKSKAVPIANRKVHSPLSCALALGSLRTQHGNNWDNCSSAPPKALEL